MNITISKQHYPLLTLTVLFTLLGGCSSEPVSDNTTLADTTTFEQPTNTMGAAGDNPESILVDNTNSSELDDSFNTNATNTPIGLRVKTLVGRTLVSLNQSINEGQQLSMQQENCLGTFDPALGESLLSIDCDQALATGDVAIYVETAGFEDTDNCHADVLTNQFDSCTVSFAQMVVNTLWTQPTSNNAQAPGRPIPVVGASLSYKMEPNKITIENLPAALSGRFSCEFDTDTQLAVVGNQTQNCDRLLQELVALIDLHLS